MDEKGENTGYKHFLLLQLCLLNSSSLRYVKCKISGTGLKIKLKGLLHTSLWTRFMTKLSM